MENQIVPSGGGGQSETTRSSSSTTMINYSAPDGNITVNQDCQILHIHESNERVSERILSKKSINTIPQAVQNFCETERYKEILNYVKEKQTLILQFYGVPGSGKTEMIKRIAGNFPYQGQDDSALFVKWHIQCKGNDSVYDELEELLKQMKKENLLLIGNFQNILHDLKNNVASSFVCALHDSNLSVLLVIEDMTCNQRLVTDFLRNVDKRMCSEESAKLHVYFTTRKISAVLQSEDERKKMPHYRLENISGFNEEESVTFLINEETEENSENYCAKRLFERFSGSPLGLRVAKGYCRKSKITYQDYLDWIEEASEDDVHQEKEEELIKEEYGENWQHVFQAIVLPFSEMYQQKKDGELIWNVLSCLSYLNQVNIPRFLLNKAFQILREDPVKNPKRYSMRESGFLISNFFDYDMCTNDSKDELISFHEVVLHAFRICQPTEFMRLHGGSAQFYQIKNAIWVMAGIITKDLRSKENKERMDKLFPHLRVLLEHVNDNEFIIPDNYTEKDLLNMVISHLYETAGAIAISTSEYRGLCEGYYKQAVDYVERSTNKVYCLPSLSLDVDATEVISKDLVNAYARHGDKLPAGFITKYESTVFSFCDETASEFLENTCKNKEVFLLAKKALQAEEKSEKIIDLLQKCNVFLPENEHRKIFFAERLASILHSWSRVILFMEDCENESLKSASLWRSSLAHEISVNCRTSFNVPLLSEKISFTTGKIPILLKIKVDEEELRKAQIYCEKRLDGTNNDQEGHSVIYEHGLLKESRRIQQLQLYKHLVSIVTKLLKTTNDCQNRENLIQKGNLYVANFFKLAKDQIHKSSSAIFWIVQCAKYFAASGNFEKAMKSFDLYFDKAAIEGSISFNDRCWAVSNYARAVVSCGRQDKKADAIAKVTQALERTDEWLRLSLKEKLNYLLEELGRL